MEMSKKDGTDAAKTQKKVPPQVEKQQQQESTSVDENEVKNWWDEKKYRKGGNMDLSEEFKNALWLYARDNPKILWLNVVEGLYFIYSPNIVRFCHSRLIASIPVNSERHENVVEVVQDVFCKLNEKDRRKYKDGNPRDTIIGYLIEITKNKCKDIIKKKERGKKLFDKLVERQLIKDEKNGQIDQPIPQVEETESLKKLIQLIQEEKNENRRTCCYLRFIEKSTLRQISEIVGISQEGVRKHIIKFKEQNKTQIQSILGNDIKNIEDLL